MALSVFAAPPALAHNFLLDVYPFFGVVEGTGFFTTAGVFPRVGTIVEVFGPNGNKVAEVPTGERGVFTYTPTQLGNHRFRADAGDGHVAEFTLNVTATDFPTLAVVPAGGDTTTATDTGAGGAPTTTVADTSGAGAATVVGGVTLAQVQTIVNQAAVGIGRTVTDLRTSIEESRERADFMSILGGIGYILGLFGIGFFVLAWTRLRAAGISMVPPARTAPGTAARPAEVEASERRNAPRREAAE
jgi:nickel transport protein